MLCDSLAAQERSAATQVLARAIGIEHHELIHPRSQPGLDEIGIGPVGTGLDDPGHDAIGARLHEIGHDRAQGHEAPERTGLGQCDQPEHQHRDEQPRVVDDRIAEHLGEEPDSRIDDRGRVHEQAGGARRPRTPARGGSLVGRHGVGGMREGWHGIVSRSAVDSGGALARRPAPNPCEIGPLAAGAKTGGIRPSRARRVYPRAV
jgi:hypothetical protein